MKRRHVIGGGLALSALGLAAIRPTDQGAPQTKYYQQIAQALRSQGLYKPTLVIDRDRLLHNIQRLNTHLPDSLGYRIVAKSLPSFDLLRFIAEHANTQRLMVFHQPFIELLAQQMPKADLLLGKPMLVGAAAETYKGLAKATLFNPDTQLQWLIDSEQRLGEYQRLAAQLNRPMRVNLEIDVGLHRGGFGSDGSNNQDDFIRALELIKADSRLEFSGLMGYEPHIVKIPKALGGGAEAFEKAQTIYKKRLDTVKNIFGDQLDLSTLTLNSGGSGTFQMYDGKNSPANELSMGSGLVMPTSFDVPTLADHLPAAYISTPVLKTMDGVTVPGLERAKHAFGLWNPNRKKTFFTYGGYWKAKPESPAGLSANPVFGRSTNQEMLNGSDSVGLETGDYVFLRPEQSEFVFLQFGDIALYDKGRITEMWPVINEGAVNALC